MKRAACTVLAAMVAVLPSGWARAENRQPAGGAFMSSYVSDPYFDPRSAYAQSRSTSDIGGQPMLVEPPGAPTPCALFDPDCVRAWERGRAPRPRGDRFGATRRIGAVP